MTTTIQNLPTAIIPDVMRHLTMTDLRSFRLTCKWAENEPFVPFARYGYSSPWSRQSKATIQALMGVIDRSEPLAKAIKFVELRWFTQGARRCWSLNDSIFKNAGEDGTGPGVAEIFSRLPGLTTLRLLNLHGSKLVASIYKARVSRSRSFGISLPSDTWLDLFLLLQEVSHRMNHLYCSYVDDERGERFWFEGVGRAGRPKCYNLGNRGGQYQTMYFKGWAVTLNGTLGVQKGLGMIVGNLQA
ncbi:hypothetical protein LTS14_004811 [Recurvomyces mirabilis]|uniref:uncharacterized protein n=1 Tax=Recurvomyces mirabilis TaxID=574656 RepID=UPI002DE03DA9|nr:hypothetical protein LTS14_004811 [Recurvomyces mirabilis]